MAVVVTQAIFAANGGSTPKWIAIGYATHGHMEPKNLTRPNSPQMVGDVGEWPPNHLKFQAGEI